MRILEHYRTVQDRIQADESGRCMLTGCSRWQSSAPPPGSQLTRLAGFPGSAMPWSGVGAISGVVTAETNAMEAARARRDVVNCIFDWMVIE